MATVKNSKKITVLSILAVWASVAAIVSFCVFAKEKGI